MGKEERTCKVCKYWDLGYGGDRPWEAKNLPHGQCLRALMWERDIDTDTSMIALDGSQYFAILMTLPTHGCHEFVDVLSESGKSNEEDRKR